ncbi:MAG: hypothetical protein RL199_1627 [Pseudomonadota bacterium]|jgi:hypothetical protein
MHPSFLLLLLACEGCLSSCFQPDLGNPPDNDPPDDPPDDPPPDTDEPDDTAPPPPCDLPEVEPNDTVGAAQLLPFSTWACGVLDPFGDAEYFAVDVEEAGWMRVWARGADFGSSADLQLVLEHSQLEERDAISSRIPGSTDAMLIVPVDDTGRWVVQVTDEQGTASERHEWELHVGGAKAPVEWSLTEVEYTDDGPASSDPPSSGQLVTDGDRVFGTFFQDDKTDREDFYQFVVPAEGKTTVTLKVEAWGFGSPADVQLQIYRLSDPSDPVRTARYGATSYDLDPLLEYTASGGEQDEVWFVKLTEELNGASPLYWYVLDVQLETEVVDPE